MRIKFLLSCNLTTRTFFIVAHMRDIVLFNFRNELMNEWMDGIVFQEIIFITLIIECIRENLH